MHAYPWTVVDRRTFIDGALKGMTVEQRTPYATRSAAIFAAGVEGYIITPYAGGAYRVDSTRIERAA